MGRGGRLLLRRAEAAGRPLLPDQARTRSPGSSRSSPSRSATATLSRASRTSAKRLRWFAQYRPELLHGLADMTHRGVEDRIRLALVDSRQARGASCDHVLDEDGMLSPHGVRSVSKRHARAPVRARSSTASASRSTTSRPNRRPTLFGGNSNWRGPVWFPLNFLLIEALQKHHYFLGDDFKVECPTGSGNEVTLWEVTTELSHRLIALFLRDADGRRPVNGDREKFQTRSALARPHPVPRVLPRRHRRGPRRQPPDRLDRRRREADPAVRASTRCRASRRASTDEVGLRPSGRAAADDRRPPLDARVARGDGDGRLRVGHRRRLPHAALSRAAADAAHAADGPRRAGQRLRGLGRRCAGGRFRCRRSTTRRT